MKYLRAFSFFAYRSCCCRSRDSKSIEKFQFQHILGLLCCSGSHCRFIPTTALCFTILILITWRSLSNLEIVASQPAVRSGMPENRVKTQYLGVVNFYCKSPPFGGMVGRVPASWWAACWSNSKYPYLQSLRPIGSNSFGMAIPFLGWVHPLETTPTWRTSGTTLTLHEPSPKKIHRWSFPISNSSWEPLCKQSFGWLWSRGVILVNSLRACNKSLRQRGQDWLYGW